MYRKVHSTAGNGWKIFGVVVTFILVAAAIFCLAVLINSAVEGLTFSEVLNKWFNSGNSLSGMVEKTEETINNTARIMFF